MRRRCFLVSLLLLVLPIAPAADSSAAEQPAWKVGIARAKITPERQLWLAGYGHRDHPAEGVLHDLWIKVLALQAPDGHRGVVVTADLLGFTGKMAENICGKLKEQCGLDRSAIMLTCSHTHTGPVLRDALYDIYPLDAKQRALIEQYSKALEETIVTTVAKALAQAAPATLWAGKGKATFAVNRRNNRESEVPSVRQRNEELNGPVDHSVPVLVVRALDGQLRAVVVGYACHCTTLSSYEWSSDYAGFAQLALEAEHPEMTAMFYQGCGADQNPLPRRSVELCQRYGNMLAAAVEKTLLGPLRPISPRLQTRWKVISLDYADQPSAESLAATAKQGGYQGRWAQRLLRELEQGHTFPKSHPYPLQAWKLGEDQLWIAMGGEVVVDYALMLKQKYGDRTWIAGYSNDVMAYIPSTRVWEEGGYEAGAFSVYGLPTDRWAPGIQQRITSTVASLVQELDR